MQQRLTELNDGLDDAKRQLARTEAETQAHR
jgi:hypothetical protein